MEMSKKRRKPVRWTLDLIRKECERHGFILLSKEYVNAKTKLDIICSCGRKNSTVIQSIRDGITCRKCGTEKVKEKLRLSYDFVKQYFKEQGCTLLSKTYNKNSEKLKYICVCGNIREMSFSHFQNGKRCKTCAGLERLTLDTVKERFKKSGVKLLTEELQDADQIFEYLCGCGRIGTISQYALRENQCCQECHFENMSRDRRHSVDYIRKEFSERGCELLENEYTNNSIPLKFRCVCGTISTITYTSFKRGSLCAEVCRREKISEKRRIPYEYYEKFFLSKGCVLLTEKIDSIKEPLLFTCHCGEEDIKGFYNFKERSGCRKCTRPKRYVYIPEEERIVTRQIDGYSQWRNSVLERDGFKCICCESQEDLTAHHMDGYKWCIERRVDVSNGKTLCAIHHRMFHSIFGIKDNTEEQFSSFMEIYNSGRLLDVLEDGIE